MGYAWKADGIKRVEVGPFREWLKKRQQHYPTKKDFAAAMDIDVNEMYRIIRGYHFGRNGKYTIHTLRVDYVDQALSNEGSTTLSELYP